MSHAIGRISRAAGVAMVGLVSGVLAGACAGPLDGERAALDRWQGAGEASQRAWRSQPAERPAASVELPDEPALADYLAYAAARNPGLEAAYHEWEAALNRVPQARALADPELSYRYVIHAMNERQAVGLSQMLPWYGRLEARGGAALAQARAAEQRFNAELLALREEVKQAYSAYVYLAQALAVMRENERIAEDLAAAARAQFEAGARAWADVVQAELALEQLGDAIATLRSRREPTVAQLNAAMGRDADAPLPWPDEALTVPAIEADESELLARLRRSNPELAALGEEAARRRHNVREARLNRVPDLMLGVEYMQMPATRDSVGLMASINLPIWGGRTEAERAEAMAAFGAANLRRTDQRTELEAELRLALADYRDAARRVRLYDERLVPMAQQSLEASEAAYIEGSVPFDALAQARTALQEMQLGRERVVVEAFDAAARLERLTGETPGYADEPAHEQNN